MIAHARLNVAHVQSWRITIKMSDIGAYFAGRQWGQHKLAVQVSPGKTWEGFWGGMATSLLCVVVIWLVAANPAYALLPSLAIGLLTALSSVVGDLLESMLKRHVQVKDSGKILPGHGGILDRIDGITAAAPVFALGLIMAGV